MCLNHLRTFKNYLLTYFLIYTFIHILVCVCVCVCVCAHTRACVRACAPWTAPPPTPIPCHSSQMKAVDPFSEWCFLNKRMKMDRVHPTLHRSAEFYPWTTSGVWRTQLRTIPGWCGVGSQESMQQVGRIVHGGNRHVWMNSLLRS